MLKLIVSLKVKPKTFSRASHGESKIFTELMEAVVVMLIIMDSMFDMWLFLLFFQMQTLSYLCVYVASTVT